MAHPLSPAGPTGLPAEADIKGHSVRGGMQLVAGRAASQVVRLGFTMVLARTLTPADFGFVAMVLAAIGLGHVLRDLGLSSAAVQRKDLTAAQANTLFWLNCVFGALMTVLFAGLAPAVAAFYSAPETQAITVALAASFFLNGLATQPLAMLQRGFHFDRMARTGLFATGIASAVALALALHGGGYWSLVAYLLVEDAAQVLLSWHYARWRPGRPSFDAATREMVSFGGYVVAFGVMGYLGRNIQNLVIGRFFGSAAVGWYDRASGLINLARNYSSGIGGTVTLAGLSALRHDGPRYRGYYMKALRVVLMAAVPIAAVTVLLAEDMVLVLYGTQWQPTAEVLRILAATMLVQPVLHSSGWLFLSRGDSRRMMWWGAAGWGLVVACVPFCISYGITGIALGYSVAIYALVIPNMLYATRGTPVTLKDVLACWWPVAGAAAVATAIAWPVREFAAPAHALIRLTGVGLVFGAAYALLLAVPFRQWDLMLDLWRQLRWRRRA